MWCVPPPNGRRRGGGGGLPPFIPVHLLSWPQDIRCPVANMVGEKCSVMQDPTLRPSLKDVDEELAHLMADQSAVNENLAEKRKRDQDLLEQMLPPQVSSPHRLPTSKPPGPALPCTPPPPVFCSVCLPTWGVSSPLPLLWLLVTPNSSILPNMRWPQVASFNPLPPSSPPCPLSHTLLTCVFTQVLHPPAHMTALACHCCTRL